MKRVITSVIVGLFIVATGSAYAQEAAAGPGKVEITIIPGGWTHFTKATTTAEPSFGNYDLGGAVALNFNRMIGVEGEIGGSIGRTQSLIGFGAPTLKEKSPSMLGYSGNVVFNAAGHQVVPFATAGIGGLTLYRRETLGVMSTQSYLVGNVGGGVKWFAPNNRWGVRGDYRLEIVNSKTLASPFFGLATRYGNRIYGGIVINAAG
jgi:hypothetical protein